MYWSGVFPKSRLNVRVRVAGGIANCCANSDAEARERVRSPLRIGRLADQRRLVVRRAADALEIKDCRIVLQRRERSRRNGDDELIVLPRLDRAAEAGNVRDRRSGSVLANDDDVPLLPPLLGSQRADDNCGGGESEKNSCDVGHEHLSLSRPAFRSNAGSKAVPHGSLWIEGPPPKTNPNARLQVGK
jgi:hypothetical protein